MKDENVYEWQTQSQGKKPGKQSGWKAKLGRKGGFKKMSFKFLVKLSSKVIVENAKVEFWGE